MSIRSVDISLGVARPAARSCALARPAARHGFTLAEVLVSLVILAMVSSAVLVVVDRSMDSAADLTLRMEAFQLAHENMEKTLASTSVAETVEFGTSDDNPQIKWQKTVEVFSEPMAGAMWARAVCSAEYVDSQGQTQTIELVHWLTDLTDQQIEQVSQRKQQEEALAEETIQDPNKAAEYAGVDVDTINRWVKDGLVTDEKGAFVKQNLDIFARADGKPTAQEKKLQVTAFAVLPKRSQPTAKPGQPAGSDSEIDPVTGLDYQQLEKMSVQEIMEIIKKRQGR